MTVRKTKVKKYSQVANTPSKPKMELKARTENQQRYIDCIEDSTITFCIGKPGTGKTFCAVAKAVEYYQKRLVKKIVITRPIVESGENLGYLPGTFEEKLRPYLIPIYDELEHFMSVEDVKKMQRDGLIEIAPLAFMRGRTFNDCFIIADELQNATYDQLIMLLTRIGDGSKMVLTGDLDQSDLNHRQKGGLKICVDALYDIDDISIAVLEDYDIVRHPIIAEILNAMTEYKERNGDA